jgi:rhodanese-related sulfurtransferase
MDISVQELREKLQSGEKPFLLDVREPWEHEEFNLGGELLPLGDIMNRLWEFDRHKGDEVVVYCKSGNRSSMARSLMEAQGFRNVRNLTGGVNAWKNAFGTEKPG